MSRNDTEGPASDDDGCRRLRVVIADDDPLARRAIRDALQDQGLVVIAEAADGHDAIELALHYEPDVVLLDIVLPRVDGVTATHRIASANADIVVVALSAAEDPELALLCLRAGAAGFLSKEMAPEALPSALQAAAAGEPVVSSVVTGALIEHLRLSSADGTGLRPVRSQLTPREWEVLDFLCQHSSTAEIADALVLSLETVRSHIKSILRKLDVRSREDAVVKAKELRCQIVGTARRQIGPAYVTSFSTGTPTRLPHSVHEPS